MEFYYGSNGTEMFQRDIIFCSPSGHSQKNYAFIKPEFQVQESKRGLFSFLKSCKNMSLVKMNLAKSPKCELYVNFPRILTLKLQ